MFGYINLYSEYYLTHNMAERLSIHYIIGMSYHMQDIFLNYENEEILKVLLKHSKQCLDDASSEGENEAGIWLGLRKWDSKWQRIYKDSPQFTQSSYSNWTGTIWEKSYQGMCAYMLKDGLWTAERDESCQFLQLCTICELPKTPVFSLEKSGYKKTSVKSDGIDIK